MTIDLRPATPEDRAFVESVYFETQRPIIEALFGVRGDTIERAKFDESYEAGHSEIVSFEGRDAGWMTVRFSATEIELEHIYLTRAEQNRGIGSELIRRLIERARDARLPLRLSTAKINRATHLYERLGFVRVDEDEYKAYYERL